MSMNACVGVLTAVDFIVSFITVALPVALPEDGNTLVGPAAELVHTTRPHVCRNTTFEHPSARLHVGRKPFYINPTAPHVWEQAKHLADKHFHKSLWLLFFNRFSISLELK